MGNVNILLYYTRVNLKYNIRITFDNLPADIIRRGGKKINYGRSK